MYIHTYVCIYIHIQSGNMEELASSFVTVRNATRILAMKQLDVWLHPVSEGEPCKVIVVFKHTHTHAHTHTRMHTHTHTHTYLQAHMHTHTCGRPYIL